MYKLMSKGTQYQKSSDCVQMNSKGLLGKRSPPEIWVIIIWPQQTIATNDVHEENYLFKLRPTARGLAMPSDRWILMVLTSQRLGAVQKGDIRQNNLQHNEDKHRDVDQNELQNKG